jgi:hypothetical protein
MMGRYSVTKKGLSLDELLIENIKIQNGAWYKVEGKDSLFIFSLPEVNATSYVVLEGDCSSYKKVASGILTKEEPFNFFGKKGKTYFIIFDVIYQSLDFVMKTVTSQNDICQVSKPIICDYNYNFMISHLQRKQNLFGECYDEWPYSVYFKTEINKIYEVIYTDDRSMNFSLVNVCDSSCTKYPSFSKFKFMHNPTTKSNVFKVNFASYPENISFKFNCYDSKTHFTNIYKENALALQCGKNIIDAALISPTHLPATSS